MRIPVILLISLTAAPAFAAPDPVRHCRAEHGGDPAAHIRCLEAALGATDDYAIVPEQEIEAESANEATSAEVPAVVPDTAAGGLGAEQVARATARQAESGDQEVSVEIVEVSYRAGLGTFRTGDGQVWRETMASPERRRLDEDRQYSARIVRGRLGGYRMHVEGVRWMKTVERVE